MKKPATPAMDKIRARLPEINEMLAAGWNYKQIYTHFGWGPQTWDRAIKLGIITRKPALKCHRARLRRHNMNVGKVDVSGMSDDVLEKLVEYASRYGMETVSEAMTEITLDAIEEDRI